MVVLVGNKCDKEELREVSEEEGRRFAAEHDLLFAEASAKTAVNVERAFLEAAQLIYEKVNSGGLARNAKAADDSVRELVKSSKVRLPLFP